MKNLSEYIKKPSNILLGLAYHGYLEWIGDVKIEKLLYYLQTGKLLNLDSPKTFNEKLQWLKIYDHNPKYTDLVDKVKAKEEVKKLIGEQHIVPILGSWSKAKDIPIQQLPDKFVLKCNHDQGSVVLVHDKNQMNWGKTLDLLNYKLNRSNYYGTREFGYKNIVPCVFAEQYLGGDIKDYKFYCFNGKPLFLYVGQGLTCDHSLKIDYFSMEWEPMPFYRTDYNRLGMIAKPAHFSEMKSIAEKLSQGVPFVRIDLFERDDKVYFSEYTLCPASGYMPFVPEEYDLIVGKWLKLRKYNEQSKSYDAVE